MNKGKTSILLFFSLILLLLLQSYLVKNFEIMPGRMEFTFFEDNQGERFYQAAQSLIHKGFLISYIEEWEMALDNQPVLVYLTDQNYKDFAAFRLIQGQWFSKDTPQAVISKKLSLVIFGSENAVGRELILEGESYSVVGVYEGNWILNKIFKNPDIIYLTGSHQQRLARGQTFRLLIASNNESTKHFLKEKFIEQISLEDNSLNFEGVLIKDMSNRREIPKQFLQGTIFLWECLIVVWLLQCLVNDFKRIVVKYKETMQTHYLKEALNEHLTQLLIIAIKWTIIIFIEIYLTREIIAFQLELPGEWLPPDYIFDMEFYGRVLLESKVTAFPSYYEGLYQKVFSFSKVLSMIALGLIMLWYLMVPKSLIMGKQKEARKGNKESEVKKAWQN